MNERIQKLNEIGQSIWYDNLSRDVLNSGELKRLIDQGVSGLTSNPTIFKKAIADSRNYDEQMRELASTAKNTEALCEQLMIKDVGAAADLLLPIYKASDGRDGFASIEVPPDLARDADKTFEAAKRIWNELKRPNIMIKIPGTVQGLKAVRRSLEEGININITLLFSVESYEAVVEQYLSALEARTAANKDIKSIASVASFFVSRVDAICEKSFADLVRGNRAKQNDRSIFYGKAGIANARLAYSRFKQLFGGARFEKLKQKGARPQRPLWASTGTKNPEFNPLMYVEELAGPDTVNTLPPATLNVLLKQGTIERRLDQKPSEAGHVISQMRSIGIEFDQLLRQLQEEGVASFLDSYRELLSAVEAKRQALAPRK